MIKRCAILTVALILGIAGCGGDSSQPGAESQRSAPETAAPESKTTPAQPSIAAGSSCQILIGWDPWEPYQFKDVDGDMRGLDIEIIEAIASRAGCELSFEEGRWATLLRRLQGGTVDLLTGATRTPARDSFAWFSEPYRTEEFDLYVRRGEEDKYTATNFVELLSGGFRIGVTEQYVYGNTITALQENPTFADQFVGATIGELNYARLLDFAIDGFLEDPFVATNYIRAKGLGDEVAKHALKVHSGEVRLMFSKASVSEDTLARINRGLEEMKADGSYQAIVNKYLK